MNILLFGTIGFIGSSSVFDFHCNLTFSEESTSPGAKPERYGPIVVIAFKFSHFSEGLQRSTGTAE